MCVEGVEKVRMRVRVDIVWLRLRFPPCEMFEEKRRLMATVN